MIERFAALFGGGDGDFEPFLYFGLPGEFGEKRRAQRHFERGVRFGQHVRNRSVSHVAKMRKVPQSDKVNYELTLNGWSTKLTALMNPLLPQGTSCYWFEADFQPEMSRTSPENDGSC